MSANVNELPADAHAALLPTRSHIGALPLWPKISEAATITPITTTMGQKQQKHWPQTIYVCCCPRLAELKTFTPRHIETSRTHMRKKGPRDQVPRFSTALLPQNSTWVSPSPSKNFWYHSVLSGKRNRNFVHTESIPITVAHLLCRTPNSELSFEPPK